MHDRLVVDSLEEGTDLVALFETGSGYICAPGGEYSCQETACERAVGDVVDVVLAEEGKKRFLVSTTEGIILSLVVAWLYVVVFRADLEVGGNLV